MIRTLRVGGSPTIGDRKRTLTALAVATLVIVTLIVAFAIRTDREIPALAVAATTLVFALSLRWPMLSLFGFVVLVPIEEAVVISGLGTLSRYAAIMFVVTYGIPRLGRLSMRAMPAAGWGYVAWAAFSVAWALDPTSALAEIPVLVLLFTVAVLLAAVVVERPGIVHPLLWAYTISASSTALVGILAYIAGGGPLGPEDRIAAIQDQNPAYYAAILLPALVFALNELFNGRFMIVSGASALLCTAAIVASGTRGAWLSAAVVFVFFLLRRLGPARRIAAFVIVAGVLAVTLQLPGIGTLVRERTDLAVSSGGSGRTDIWSVGLRIFGSAPITGVGIANFSIAFTPERVRDVPVEITNPATLTNRAPHNIAIGTLGELGIVGIVLLATLLVPLVVRRGWGPDATVVQAALASLLILAMFLDVLNRKEVWLLVGIACGLSYLARRRNLPAAVPPPRLVAPRSIAARTMAPDTQV